MLTKRIVDTFNNFVEHYEKWYEEPLGRYVVQTETLALLHLLPKKGLGIEVGCGTGVFAKEIMKRTDVENVICLDPAFCMLRRAQKKGLDCVNAIITPSPIRENSIDFAFMITVLEFLVDPLRDLLSIRNLLKEERPFVLMFINKESIWGRLYQELATKGEPILSLAKFYSLEDVLSLLKNAGYMVTELIGILDFPPDKVPDVEPYIIEKNVRECGAIFVKAFPLIATR